MTHLQVFLFALLAEGLRSTALVSPHLQPLEPVSPVKGPVNPKIALCG